MFLDRADKLYAGLAYICSWSSTRVEALKFAQPLNDRALLRISQEDLIECLLSCFARWNGLQPGEYEMTDLDGCYREDWSPRAVRYAYGKMDYTGRAECSTASPFRMGRAMRLPGGNQGNNLQEEDEWRIALDLSEVSSSIRTERMVKTELMPRRLGSIALSSESDELEPMISFNACNGLWLNDLNLNEAESFSVETL